MNDIAQTSAQLGEAFRNYRDRTRRLAAPYYVELTDGDIKLDQGTYFKLQVHEPLSLRVLNLPANEELDNRRMVAEFTLQLRASEDGVLEWFPGIRWPGGRAPVFNTESFDLFRFLSCDGGASWLAVIEGQDYRLN